MNDKVKLQVSLPRPLERAMRLYMAEVDRSRKGDLSEFFAELLRQHLLDWVRERAATTGHSAELAPERLAVTLAQLGTQPTASHTPSAREK